MRARPLIQVAWLTAFMLVGPPAFAANPDAAWSTAFAAIGTSADPSVPANAPADRAAAGSSVSDAGGKQAAEKPAADKPTSDKAPKPVADKPEKAPAEKAAAAEKSDKAAKATAEKPGAEKPADKSSDSPGGDPSAAQKSDADSARGPVPPPVLAARSAYESAFEQRRKGDALGVIATVENAMPAIEAALAAQPDASVRRDLVDYQSRLVALQDAAKHELEAPQTRTEPGNEADEKVLNAPAIDDIPLQMNTDVQHWIEFFCGAGRSTFERWLKRSGRYVELFRAVLQKEGLPPDLVHLVFVESGFNLNARSVSAAVGPWQFVKGTARLLGLTVDRWVDERKDPEKSTVAAARYLKHLYGIFGDWPLALASYNAGPGAVLRAIKAQGTTNYWDLRLPQQTEQYVPQFMAALAISRDPAGYGFDDVDLDDPMQFDEVALKGAVDLRAIARLCECSYEDLRALNPAVLRGAARPRDGITVIRVPPGKGEVLRQKLAQGAPLPAVNLTLKHKVTRGETLSTIASRYDVSARRLAQVNGIGRRRPLRTGMVLTVPAQMTGPAPAALDDGDPRASTSYVPERAMRPPTAVSGKSIVVGRTSVVVRRGQTLSSIAADHGVTVEDIRRWNHLKSARVRPGTHLKLRTPDAPPAELAARDSSALASISLTPRHHRRHRGPAASRAGAHTVRVRSGDTLDEIARRNGTSVDALRKANALPDSRIRSGQRLKLPRG